MFWRATAWAVLAALCVARSYDPVSDRRALVAALAALVAATLGPLLERAGGRSLAASVLLLGAEVAAAAAIQFLLPPGAIARNAPFLVAVADAYTVFGSQGAAWVSTACAVLAATGPLSGALPGHHPALALEGALPAALGAFLWATGWRGRRLPPTVLPARTVDTVERAVDDIAERERRLRASYQEVVAVARARQAEIEEARLIGAMLQAAAEGADAEQGYRNVLRLLASALGAESGAAWRVRPSAGSAILRVATGPAARRSTASVPLAPAALPAEVRAVCERALTGAGAGAAAAVCLRMDGEIWGVVGVAGAALAPDVVSSRRRLGALAEPVSTALWSIEARHSAVRHAELEVGLRRLASLPHLGATDEAAARCLAAMRAPCRCDSGALWLHHAPDGAPRLAASFGQVSPPRNAERWPGPAGAAGWCAAHALSIWLPDTTSGSHLVVPVAARGRGIGAVWLGDIAPGGIGADIAAAMRAAGAYAGAALGEGPGEQTDALTGLLHEARFTAALEGSDARRALFVTHLDGIDRVAERHGAAAADGLLSAFAALLVGAAPVGSTLGLLGGDPAALVAVADARAARELAEEVRRAVLGWREPYAAALGPGPTASVAYATDGGGLARAAGARAALAAARDSGGNAVYAAL
ncbi:MAG: GGDEF domain-containing protein [Chthonomonadales bacterium]|nr:GGDEF domain-containing protein [Chthonomonadales bacterium]